MFEVEVAERELRFVEDADLVVACLGAGAHFILIDMSGGYSDRAKFEASVAQSKARGFVHCGYLRVKAGTPDALCYDPRGMLTLVVAGMAWMRSLEGDFRASAVQPGEWDRFINNLHALPDTRTQWPN
jgi:hypothetical protein